MGIDGIGKRGGPAPQGPSGPSAKRGAGEVDRPFEVERPGATEQAAAARGADPASPLARLRAGEIDVNKYVDLKVDEATRGLDGLPKADLDEIRAMLRARVAEDPALVDLVRNATGKAPAPPEE